MGMLSRLTNGALQRCRVHHPNQHHIRQHCIHISPIRFQSPGPVHLHHQLSNWYNKLAEINWEQSVFVFENHTNATWCRTSFEKRGITRNTNDLSAIKIPKMVHFTTVYETNNTFATYWKMERCIGSAGMYFVFPNEYKSSILHSALGLDLVYATIKL